MSRQLTADDARQSLTDHVVAKGIDVFVKYGPQIGRPELARLLQDQTVVRYPCVIEYAAAGLQPGECAHPTPKGARPEDGFTMYVHPGFRDDVEATVAAVLYQLVVVNYGGFASAVDAESFGAAALGLTCDEYYLRLCALADRIADSPSP